MTVQAIRRAPAVLRHPGATRKSRYVHSDTPSSWQTPPWPANLSFQILHLGDLCETVPTS